METFKGKKAEKGFIAAQVLDTKIQQGERLRSTRSLSGVRLSFFEAKEQSKTLLVQSKARLVANTAATGRVHARQFNSSFACISEKLFLGFKLTYVTGFNYV